MPLTPEARDLVIRAILGEASGEGPDGMMAVANVIKNRLNSGVWGPDNRIGPVINAPKQFTSMAGGGKAYNPNDPNYQRAGAIADAVFSDQAAADNTGGATHFYANKGPNAIAAPGWANGATNVRQIGNQIFMTQPFSAANTAGTGVTGPSSAPPPGTSPVDAQAARTFLSTLSAHTDRAGDTANLNPDFAVRLASAVKQAKAEGLPVSVFSAFREPGQTGTATQAGRYDAGGNSSHSYGLAADIAGLDGPNGKVTQRWAQIAQANGLSNPYGIGDGAEYSHWQLPPVPLEQTPQLLASLKAAKATGNFASVWAAYQPTGETARPGPYQPTGEAEANKPAPLAKPVAAVAPPASAPIAPTPQNSSAGSPGAPDPNARFQVLQTMGQGGRPGLPYTALNLAPGAGSTPTPAAAAAPAAPAAAAAAPPAARPDLTQRVPLNQTQQPLPRPTPSAIGAYPDSTSYPQYQPPQSQPVPTPPPPVPPAPQPSAKPLSPDWPLTQGWPDSTSYPQGPSIPFTSTSNPIQDMIHRLFSWGS